MSLIMLRTFLYHHDTIIDHKNILTLIDIKNCDMNNFRYFQYSKIYRFGF